MLGLGKHVNKRQSRVTEKMYAQIDVAGVLVFAKQRKMEKDG